MNIAEKSILRYNPSMLKRVRYFLQRYLLEGVLLLILVVFLFIQEFSLFLSFSVLFLYVLFVLLFNNTFLIKGINKGINDIKKTRWYWLLILIFIVLLFIWQLSLENIIFLTLFVSFALYDWNSRVVAAGALFSLVLCSILLIAKQDVYAEQMAIYTFYFLVITVVLRIIEYKRRPELFNENRHEKK